MAEQCVHSSQILLQCSGCSLNPEIDGELGVVLYLCCHSLRGDGEN